jgi:hypothetical protein
VLKYLMLLTAIVFGLGTQAAYAQPTQGGGHLGLKSYLDEMLTAPFEPFTFTAAGASVYQLGDFGTARKNLKTLGLKP